MAGNFRGVLIFVIFVVDLQQNFEEIRYPPYGSGRSTRKILRKPNRDNSEYTRYTMQNLIQHSMNTTGAKPSALSDL